MKWSCQSVECLTHAIPEKQYQAQIAELTKILYAAFRQLETQDENPVQSDCQSGTKEVPQADSTKHPFPITVNLADGEVPSAA
jgi:hypothetical protein